MMSQQSDFYVTALNAQNIKFLPDLIDGQAQHHHTNFSGTESKLKRDFLAASAPVAHIDLIYNKQMGAKPIGYIAYNESVSEKGTGLYLEDIFITKQARSAIRGAGSYGFVQLIDTALNNKMDYIQWAVAMNNEAGTFYFYENKIGAGRLDKVLYDVDSMITGPKTHRPEYIHPDVSARPATKADINMLASAIINYPAPHGQSLPTNLMSHIEKAIDHHNADVYLSFENNKIIGLTFANANYSTFRTVTGYKAEPMITFTDNANLYQQALYATAQSISDQQQKRNWDGHLVWGVTSADSLAHRFMTSQGGDVLLMESHDFASTLVMYGIDKNNICPSKRNSLIHRKP